MMVLESMMLVVLMHLADLYVADVDDDWLLMQVAQKGKSRCLLVQNASGQVWQALKIHQLLTK